MKDDFKRMDRVKASLAALGALALTGLAGEAMAQTRAPAQPSTRAANANDAYALNGAQRSQVLEMDASRRFGLKLEIQQPVTRPTELKDMEAGAFYKLTPSLRLGGTVGVTDAAAPTADKPDPARTTPRVRLGASFKF